MIWELERRVSESSGEIFKLQPMQEIIAGIRAI
jgi:hypothetical protein